MDLYVKWLNGIVFLVSRWSYVCVCVGGGGEDLKRGGFNMELTVKYKTILAVRE